MLFKVNSHLGQRKSVLIKSLVSGVDTCFWQVGCSKLNLGTPIFLCSIDFCVQYIMLCYI